MHKLRSIQVLRAFAACAVVILHTVPDVHTTVGTAGYGAAGVDLFFVISGFIIAKVVQKRTPSEFLADRLWRIYPLWWTALLPWLFMVPRGTTSIASSLTLWPVYEGGYYMPVLKVGWTLSFELLFYAGMALAMATRAWVPLTAYLLFTIGAITTSRPFLHFVGNPLIAEFLMGVAVARLPRRTVVGLFVPLGFMMLALTSPGLGDVDSSLAPQWALRRALEWGFPAALILWGALSLEPFFNRPVFDLPVAIGDASYSIYLFHPLIAYGLDFAWPVRLSLAIGAGWAMHLLIERRIMRMRSTAIARLLPAAPLQTAK